jgi:predicted transcriptional regulator
MNKSLKWFFELKSIHKLSTNDMYVLMFAMLNEKFDSSNLENVGAEIGVHCSSVIKAFNKLTECGLLDGKSNVKYKMYKELSFTSKINAEKVQETRDVITEVLKKYKLKHNY